MKKILILLLLIIGFLNLSLVFGKVLAADAPSSSFEFFPKTAKVGEQITINYTATNLPSNTEKISLEISSGVEFANFYEKEHREPPFENPQYGQYPWTTSSSAPGKHNIILSAVINGEYKILPGWTSYELTSTLAESDATSSFTFSPASGSAKVGDTIKISYSVTKIPASAKKLELYIDDIDGTANRKDWKDLTGASEVQLSYDWDTKAAGSSAGNHKVYVKIDGATAAGQTTFNLLDAEGKDVGDTADIDKPGDTETSFTLDKLGTVIFPTTKVGSVKELIAVIITWMLSFMGALAVVAIVYSGLMYITAGSDATRAETAKKNLVWAIIGILLVAFSIVIVQVISNMIKG